MEEAESKFKELGTFIPFLESFMNAMKIKADNNEEVARKYDKAEQLLQLLTGDFNERKHTITNLENIENVLKKLVNIVHCKKNLNQIKSEKVESVEPIKMENDYQSPESPPMNDHCKNEREPINIPTERRDSNMYYYDSKPSTSKFPDRHNDRYDDYKRHHDVRRYRDRSRSRSPRYSRSPSYERRGYDRNERKRYSRSPSYERRSSYDRNDRRRRSRSRDRWRDRSRSRSPSYRRISPSYQRRSKSPHQRHRSDRRDDRKYERERDYQLSDYGRNVDTKRYVKLESDSNYKKESNWRIGSSVKQEEPYRSRDEPSASSTRFVNPMSRFGSSTATVTSTSVSNRQASDNIKHEFDRDSDRISSRPKPLPTIGSRFGSLGTSSMEASDLFQDKIKQEDEDEVERKTRSMFGTTEGLEALRNRMDKLKEIDKIRKEVYTYQNKELEKDIISQLDLAGALDDMEVSAPTPSSPPAINTPSSPPAIQNNIQNDFRNEIRHETRHQIHNESRDEFSSRIENRTDNRRSGEIRMDDRAINRPEIRNEIHRQVAPISSIAAPAPAPAAVPPTITPTATAPQNPFSNRVEERIALSDKYQRRKRSDASANVPVDSYQLPHDRIASQQPQPDPRLRGRSNACTITSGASLTEQFNSYRHPQGPPHLPPFGAPNFNRQNSSDACSPQQQQRPFFNDPFHPHQQQQHPHPHHPNMMQSRHGPHMQSPPNNYSPNIVMGPNAMQPHPHVNNPFSNNRHPNQHHHQHPQQRNYQQHHHQQDEKAKETYGDHRRKMAQKREEEERRRKLAASVSSTTAQNTADEQNKECPEEPPTQSAPQIDNTKQKDTDKEKPRNKVDNAFRSNNWEALPQSKSGSSFKIPKLNKSNSNTSTTRTSTDAKRDSPEDNVSTSTKTTKSDTGRTDPRSKSKNKTSSKNRKSSTDAKKVDNKKGDEKLPEDDQIHADTTIMVESESPQEQPANATESQNDSICITSILETIKNKVSADKLDVIKRLLSDESNTQSNDDAVTSSTQPVKGTAENSASTKAKANQSKAEAKTPKKLKKYQNELERLTADIRENIPDVLSATGRRTCTLNTQKSTDSSPAKTPKSVERTAKASGHKSDDEAQSDNDKPKRITRRRNTTVDARKLAFDNDDNDTPSENTEAQPLKTRITNRRDNICEPNTRNSIDSIGERDESAKNKPGPKSSKKDAKSTESSSDDQNLASTLPKCTVVLETVNVSKEMQRITRSSKRKAEQMSSSGDSESLTEKEADDDSLSEPKRPKIDIRNTDKTITTKSKRCHICDKNFQFLSSHYANNHEGEEVYSARMSVVNSNKIRKTAPRNATYRGGKFTAYCYYCEKDVTYERSKWIAHFVRHTGEYTRSCTKCGIKLTANTDKNDVCVHSEKVVPMVEFEETLHVYMCNYCNYTQYQEENMKNHIRNMHEINVNITEQYVKINLIPNFMGPKRTGRRLPSATTTAASESETTANSEDVVNEEVFKSSNQDDDVHSDAFKLMKENTFNSLDSTKSPPTTISIADMLKRRLNQQKESRTVVKQEAVDTHEIVYRSPDEMAGTSNKSGNASTRPSPLVDGGVIENGCKIELSKTEAQASGGTQPTDMDDDQDWESCSDEEEEENSPSKSLNLSRLIINKPKANKGRKRLKKRGDKSILSTLKKEKPDEVIDLDKEIKTEKKTPEKPFIRPIQGGQKRVDNIAYSEFLGTQKFSCFIGNCDFLSKNNPKSLSNHIRQKHGTERWNGNCYACEKQVMNVGNYSLMKEFDHMMDIHVPNPNPAPKLIVRVPEPPPQPPVEDPKPEEPPRQPVIRIRPISELTKPQSAPQAPEQVQPQPQLSILTISSINSIPVTQQPIDTVYTAPDYDNHLKPWTQLPSTKAESAEAKLKRDYSLIALFKCMAIDCIFTTNDKDSMLEHLRNHEDFIEVQASYGRNHSNQDCSSWLECCYCEEYEGSCSTLVEHIISEHATSIFQCPYCFYRSVDRYNVSSHLKQYHSKYQDEQYILVCGTETKGLSTEIADILQEQLEKVKVMQCPDTLCNATFLHFLDLNKHSRSIHSDKLFYTCKICSSILKKSPNGGDIDYKHFHEHGFSLCHCAYCSYHCMDTASMHAHLRDEHATKLPYSFVRIPNNPPQLRLPTIAYFHESDAKTHSLVCLPLTEAQLNFMKPSLSECVSNASDPPGDTDCESSVAAVDKAQFNRAQKLDEFETKNTRQQYQIQTIDALILGNKQTIPTVHVASSSSSATPAVASTSSATENFVTTEYDAIVQSEIDTTANALLSETGIESSKLYRCSFAGCTWVRSDEREFLMHLSQHQHETVYTCFHCRGSFGSPVELKNHIKSHLKHRFFCFYCNVTTPTQQAMNDHFEKSHRNEDASYLPLNQLQFNEDTDIFIGCPKNTQNINDFIRRLVDRFTKRQAAKKSYMPEEADLLPKSHIYSEAIQCGRCGFSDKTRINLMRHFRNGCTEQQAPINPVPCLNTNERHFDKMRNLAASSNSSGADSGLGKYVPESKRYVCGAKSCQYQTVSAEMLRQHIVTLHESEKCFGCPHCGEDLSTSATEILNHLRYHDSKIFKCPNCLFVHYLKPQVEKHINELHPISKERAITLERPAKKVEPVKPAAKPVTYKWSCNICSKIFNTKALVKAHLGDVHRLTNQFKCSICSFSHDTKNAIKEHLTTEHRENDATKIKSNFDRIESEADNTPIWRRDDPTRVKHIRGILFDDAEKTAGTKTKAQSNNNKNQSSIHLEIKAVNILKPVATAKKAKLSQDDSAITYKIATQESPVTDKIVQQKFNVVARSNNSSGSSTVTVTNNESDRFIVLPPKESVEEEVRPRPASLRQQPKRRFSMYIQSPLDNQPSTSTAQPPISLRLKRVSDPVPDEEKMPPPKVFKMVTVKPAEKTDLSALNLIYVCNYCQFQVDSFDKVHAHWLSVHKRGDNNDPIAKRFCYRVTQMVKCLLCPANMTFQTIRTHMQKIHPHNPYAFGKYDRECIDKKQCGICSVTAPDATALQNHFRTDHPQSQRPDMKIEPLPILTDAILDELLKQGDSGTFKCSYCFKHFPCRYDYEQHHNEDHSSNRQRYETNGKDVIKYGCNYCREIYTDENMAIVHMRSHIQSWFQCTHCPKKVQYIKLIQTHHQLMHEGKELGYRLINARDNLNLFYQMTLTFSNGLALIWGDVLKTKYGGVERLVKYINELNEQQRLKQMDALANSTSAASQALQNVGKVCRRRQTLL